MESKKVAHNARTRTITVRLTAEEDALVTTGAKLRGISKSDYLRSTLGKVVADQFAHAGQLHRSQVGG